MLYAIFNDANDSWHNDNAAKIYTSAEFDSISEEDDDGLDLAAEGHHQTQVLINSLPEGHMEAEFVLLHLPSHLGHAWCNKNGAKDLAMAELHLWEGQLNDSLHHICIALGHKFYLFRSNVCPAYM
jgi:hypothetical protein